MAKKKQYDESEGVWRTIGGRRVFIRNGQSLSEAMKESGKFKKTSDVKRGEYQDLEKELKANKTEYLVRQDAKEQGAYTGDMTNEVWAGKHVEGGPNSYKEKNSTQNMANDRSKAVQDVINGLSVDKGFTQNVDMTGDVRLYNQNELNRMEEAGIKPMANSYTGGGWEGTNYDSKLTTKEIGKRVTDEMKKQFPDLKISRRGDNYSMGSSIDFNIMESSQDVFVSEKDIDNMTDFGRLSVGIGFENWAEQNVKGFKRYTNEVYTTDDVRKYAKEALNNIKSHEDQNVRGDEWYLSDYGKKVVSELNRQANSYTYSDNDGMVDYFDHGTYMSISIGKWDKPYQVATSNSIKNAYKQYLKEHKDSNMSLEEFKKLYK